jgi:hypothetical protein
MMMTMPKFLNQNKIIFYTLLILSIIALYIASPITQNPAYHHFADQRIICGVPHIGDVLSNLSFIAVGIILFFKSFKEKPVHEFQQFMFGFFCVSAVALGLGSAYYHWNPSDKTLIWDRMTMVFGFSVIFMDSMWRYNVFKPNMMASKFAVCFFLFCATVVYSKVTNRLEPYVLVQFFTLLIILVLALVNLKSINSHAVLMMVGTYIIAKIFEYYDLKIWLELHQVVSGHTLKHLMYALSLYFYGIYMKESIVKLPINIEPELIKQQ